MNTDRKLCAATICLIVISISLLIVIPLLSGCSTVRKTSQKITQGFTRRGGKQKKKIAIAVFENKTFFDTPTFQNLFHQTLSTYLGKECAENIYIKPENEAYPDFLAKLPRHKSGDIDNFALAKTGRKLGFNAIVTGSFVSIKTSEKMKGVIWFKEARPTIKINVATAVYDTETGAILFDENFEREMEVDENLVASIRAKKAKDAAEIKAALKQIIDPVGDKICDQISDQPWKGFIISIAANKVVLSSGRETGIVPGDILEVYDSAAIFEGMDGRKFFLPGLKSGEIKITAVYPNRSEATIISGENIRAGSSVKPR